MHMQAGANRCGTQRVTLNTSRKAGAALKASPRQQGRHSKGHFEHLPQVKCSLLFVEVKAVKVKEFHTFHTFRGASLEGVTVRGDQTRFQASTHSVDFRGPRKPEPPKEAITLKASERNPHITRKEPAHQPPDGTTMTTTKLALALMMFGNVDIAFSLPAPASEVFDTAAPSAAPGVQPITTTSSPEVIYDVPAAEISKVTKGHFHNCEELAGLVGCSDSRITSVCGKTCSASPADGSKITIDTAFVGKGTDGCCGRDGDPHGGGCCSNYGCGGICHA